MVSNLHGKWFSIATKRHVYENQCIDKATIIRGYTFHVEPKRYTIRGSEQT